MPYKISKKGLSVSREDARIRQIGIASARLAIRGYQTLVSPCLPNACRFYPSCSEYAHQAIGKYGLSKGGWLAFRRILRCHPFHPGGLDPVP